MCRKPLGKGVVVMLFVLGLAGAAPALAAKIAGTEVKVDENIDVLNSPDRTVFVKVSVERKNGPLTGHRDIVVDHFHHRAQHEEYNDLSYGWTGVDGIPIIGPQYIYEQEYNAGPPCITCKKIDRVCGLLGDRC